MQGDLDIVDPLVDEYLARLAGSPDPVEAEMRRYADERDGFPIVGPVVGGLLHQLSLLVRARRTLDDSARVALYRRIDERVYRGAPWLYLWFPVELWAHRPDVRGWDLALIFTGQRWTAVRRTP